MRSTSGAPASTPSCLATIAAVARSSPGTVSWVVRSPRPMSSASATSIRARTEGRSKTVIFNGCWSLAKGRWSLVAGCWSLGARDGRPWMAKRIGEPAAGTRTLALATRSSGLVTAHQRPATSDQPSPRPELCQMALQGHASVAQRAGALALFLHHVDRCLLDEVHPRQLRFDAAQLLGHLAEIARQPLAHRGRIDHAAQRHEDLAQAGDHGGRLAVRARPIAEQLDRAHLGEDLNERFHRSHRLSGTVGGDAHVDRRGRRDAELGADV